MPGRSRRTPATSISCSRPPGRVGTTTCALDASEAALGTRVVIASLRDVIRMKEAAGRPKDVAQLPALRQTLEVIRERERRSKG